MRLGILITGVGNFNNIDFYNSQDVGLAKALDRFFDEIIIYKAVQKKQKRSELRIAGLRNTRLCKIPVYNLGINGLWNCSVLDPTVDSLLFFSDTQISVPMVYRWCKRNRVKLFPYIGITESHSRKKIRKSLINLLLFQNIKAYKQCICFAKTPYVKAMLEKRGVHNTVLAPIGIDTSLFHFKYNAVNKKDLKAKWGYCSNDKVILFVGRMVEEKHPIEMISLFKLFFLNCRNYKLLMVGKGELLETARKYAEGLNVRFIEEIPNRDIWELYCLADAFVNLSRQEIYGMAILEAMYYGCMVVAWKAPGPNYIIEDGVSGYLVDSEELFVKELTEGQIEPIKAHKRVIEFFSWDNTAQIIISTLKSAEKEKKC